MMPSPVIRKNMPELDSVRGIAVLLVVLGAHRARRCIPPLVYSFAPSFHVIRVDRR